MSRCMEADYGMKSLTVEGLTPNLGTHERSSDTGVTAILEKGGLVITVYSTDRFACVGFLQLAPVQSEKAGSTL